MKYLVSGRVRMSGFGFTVMALALCAQSPSVARALDNPNVELVESVPLETTLAVSGIRQTQAVWLEMIQSAQSQIDLEQFYISDQAGEALAPVLDAITKASQRGVRVRVLVDSGFYKTYPDSVNQFSRQPGIETRTVDYSSLGGVQHAKFFVIDGQESFVGSQNFDWRALSHIHEIGLRMTDTVVAASLESVFQVDWAAGVVIGSPSSSVGQEIIPSSGPSDPSLQTLASPDVRNPPGIAATLDNVVDLIGSAASSVRIQVMEYTTEVYGSSARWMALDTAIRQAAARGVQVQLMVDVSDLKKAKASLQALANLKNIQVRLVTIPQWSGGAIPFARLIHSKYMIVDGSVAWVGSENWSESYFTETRNVGIVAKSPELATKLNQIFAQVWQSTYTSKP